ncbi:MAG: CDP-alcohol phosphatidyltransferase family protein [Gammaproteobacteria bacterium]|nr:CDP-alcohol phosphatidyltransferase family protein [Gammaproteobacteria bacterium]
MTLRDLPNLISLLRMVLVIPVVYLMEQREFGLALILFAIAGISDGLDGYLAKRNNWASRLGSILDPLADKLLLVSAYLVLAWLGELPVWLVIAVLVRDVIIILGVVVYHYLIGQFEMVPSWISKLNTFFQIMLVLVIVFSLGVYTLPAILIDALVIVVIVTTLTSGIDYIWVWARRAAYAEKRKQQ